MFQCIAAVYKLLNLIFCVKPLFLVVTVSSLKAFVKAFRNIQSFFIVINVYIVKHIQATSICVSTAYTRNNMQHHFHSVLHNAICMLEVIIFIL